MLCGEGGGYKGHCRRDGNRQSNTVVLGMSVWPCVSNVQPHRRNLGPAILAPARSTRRTPTTAAGLAVTPHPVPGSSQLPQRTSTLAAPSTPCCAPCNVPPTASGPPAPKRTNIPHETPPTSRQAQRCRMRLPSPCALHGRAAAGAGTPRRGRERRVCAYIGAAVSRRGRPPASQRRRPPAYAESMSVCRARARFGRARKGNYIPILRIT